MGSDSDNQSTCEREDTSVTLPSPVFETQYEYGSETDGLTVIIIDAIANAMDTSPTEIVPKINESVDPDALERILRPLPDGTERDGYLTFYLVGFRITVDSDGTVSIYDERDY